MQHILYIYTHIIINPTISEESVHGVIYQLVKESNHYE